MSAPTKIEQEQGESLKGTFIQVRLMREEDTPFIVAWRNHPEVARWLIQWEPLRAEQHLKFLAAARDRGDVLMTFLDLNGTPIGTGAIYDFDRNRKVAEWGRLCMDPEGENSLTGIEASYLAMRIGFEHLSLNRIHARCSSENKGARRLLKMMGYREEGTRPQHLAAPDGYRDVVEYGLMRDYFEAQSPKIHKLLYRGPGATVPALKGDLA